MPNVSVIIPAYNRRYLLQDALESVLRQDYSDYEIIVVDDGSPDNTYNTLKKYKGHIRYIYQKHKGVSSARNTGIRAAEGAYIAFLDSDDLWMPAKLSMQMQFIQKMPDTCICYTREKWIRYGRAITPPQIYMPPLDKDIFQRLLSCCFIGASSVIIRRDMFDLIGYFDENLPCCEDLDLWLRIAVRYPIYLVNDALTVKRMGKWQQLSTGIWGQDRYRIQAYEKLLRIADISSYNKHLVLSAIHKKAYILARGGIRHRRFGMALRYGWKWLKSSIIKRFS